MGRLVGVRIGMIRIWMGLGSVFCRIIEGLLRKVGSCIIRMPG